jgi:hypothetical protein
MKGRFTKISTFSFPMKKVRSLTAAVLAATLLSSFADPQYDPNAPIKPLPVPTQPDRINASYAIGMNLGLQRQQAKSDMDVDVFIKGMKDLFENKKTEIPFSDTMQVMNLMRTRGANATPEEKRKFAYAMGVRMGNSLKENASDCDIDVVAGAIKDVTDGKPTKLKQSDLEPLLEEGRLYSWQRKPRNLVSKSSIGTCITKF